MRFDVRQLPQFRHTVTVLNRLDGRDSPDCLDHWKKTVLEGCAWTETQTRREGAEAAEETAYLVRVPASPDYRPYALWRADREGFTFSPGDYMVKGTVPEEVTAATVQAVAQAHRPAAFLVQLVRDNTGGGVLEHYRVEGK